MIELRIVGETAQDFMAKLGGVAATMQIGQVVLAQRAAQHAAQAEQATDQTAMEQVAAEQQATEPPTAPAEAPKRGRGRPPKNEAPASVQQAEQPAPAADDLEVPDQFKRTAEAPKSEIVVPKDLEGLRGLIQKVCGAKSPQVTEAIIKKYGEKTSLIPVEKYPDVAAELHAAMVG